MLVVSGSPNISVPTRMAVIGSNTPSTEAVNRKMATTTYDPEFDDDVEVEGSVRFSLNGYNSVLPMANDGYYGSDFYEILCVIDWLYTCRHLGTEEIECINISLADYSAEMSS